jgi:hypothetical protein
VVIRIFFLLCKRIVCNKITIMICNKDEKRLVIFMLFALCDIKAEVGHSMSTAYAELT